MMVTFHPRMWTGGDNGAPQGPNGGGDTVETEVYGYWDLLDKLAGI